MTRAHTVGALQNVVVLALEASFAHEVAGAKLAVAVLDLLFTDFPDVPAGMRHETIGKVPAAMDHQHFEQRNIRAMRLDKRDVCRSCFGFDNDGLKFGQFTRVVELIRQVVNGDAEAFGYRRQALRDERRIVAEEKNAERRVVIDQNPAVAIEHAAARRNDRYRADAVTVGPLRILVGIDDLEFPESDQQKADHAYDDVGDDSQPSLRQSIIVAEPVRHEIPARAFSWAACIQPSAAPSLRLISA